jgi:hypothetical protein
MLKVINRNITTIIMKKLNNSIKLKINYKIKVKVIASKYYKNKNIHLMKLKVTNSNHFNKKEMV